MNDSFVERITRTRTDKEETVSGRLVETRSQKSTEEQKAMAILILLYRFFVENIESRPVFMVKIAIFSSPHKSPFLRNG